MPLKSIREMTSLERKHHSLEAKVFRSTIMGAFILGIAALIVAFGLYVYALAGQYIGEAFSLTKSVSPMVREVADVGKLSDDIMKIYNGLSDEEQKKNGTKEYAKHFAEIMKREDYVKLRRVLKTFAMSGDVDDIYISFLDMEKSRIIYLVDPDNKWGDVMLPGEYEEVDKKYIQKFLNWDGKGKLYQLDYFPGYGFYGVAGVPFNDMNGNLKACIMADISLVGMRGPIIAFLIQYFLVILLVTIVLGVIMARHMRKKLAVPINGIAEAAVGYVNDKRKGVKGTDHFSSLDIHTGDEIENLALIMGDMEKDLSEFEDNLTKVTAEKERINTELDLANRIQADMLPNIYPAFPERSEFEIYAAMDPAKEVGGDFYDFFLIDDDHLCIEIADVSGKGVPAALFMMASKIIFGDNAIMGKSPAQILEDTNNNFCKSNREEMFVTVWLGILEISTGIITAANAGHEYPIVMQNGEDYEVIKDKHGFVVGGMEGMKYHEYEMQLTPGSKLFIYTDGVTEATDKNGELFGMDRLVDALNETKEKDPYGTLDGVRKSVDKFVGEAEQFDDLTMLSMEWRGPKNDEGKE